MSLDVGPKIPFFAIGNEEIQKAPMLGKKIVCDRCGKTHIVRYGKKEINAFYKCSGKEYLAGINGKDIRGSFEKEG